MKKSAFFIIIVSVVCFWETSLPVQAQMLNMVKGMINQFADTKPAEFEYDEVVEQAVPFPPEITIDQNLYPDALKETSNLFQLTDFQNGYVEINGKEYPTNSFRFVFMYVSLPCFQCINTWYENISVKDMESNNLLMKEKEIEEYRELGIIDDEFDFPVPGEFSETFWLNRELNWEENITVSGEIKLEYPSEYESAVFTQADTSLPQTIGDVTYQLIGMDRNMVTLLVKGDRREEENIKMILLNKENLPFGSVTSVAIDAEMYDMEKKTAKAMTDEELQASIEGFDLSNPNVEQVKKIEVNGTIDKLVLLKVNNLKTLEQSFKVDLTAGY